MPYGVFEAFHIYAYGPEPHLHGGSIYDVFDVVPDIDGGLELKPNGLLLLLGVGAINGLEYGAYLLFEPHNVHIVLLTQNDDGNDVYCYPATKSNLVLLDEYVPGICIELLSLQPFESVLAGCAKAYKALTAAAVAAEELKLNP